MITSWVWDVILGWWKGFETRGRCFVIQHCECTNATLLYTLKWLIVYYVKFTSIRKSSCEYMKNLKSYFPLLVKGKKVVSIFKCNFNYCKLLYSVKICFTFCIMYIWTRVLTYGSPDLEVIIIRKSWSGIACNHFKLLIVKKQQQQKNMFVKATSISPKIFENIFGSFS